MPSIISAGRGPASQLENLCRDKHLAAIWMWLLFSCWLTAHAGSGSPLSQAPPYASNPTPRGRIAASHKKHIHRADTGTYQPFWSIFFICKIQDLDSSSTDSNGCMSDRSSFTKKEKNKSAPPTVPASLSIHYLVSRLQDTLPKTADRWLGWGKKKRN